MSTETLPVLVHDYGNWHITVAGGLEVYCGAKPTKAYGWVSRATWRDVKGFGLEFDERSICGSCLLSAPSKETSDG